MKLFIFTEHYPSPYKPYFDTQFSRFIADSHEIKIYSAAKQGDYLEEKVIKWKIDKLISYVPTTLKTIPKFFLKIVNSFLKNPVIRMKAVFRIFRKEISFKSNVLNIARMAIIPIDPPDACLVHNLITACEFNFLKDFYINIPIGFYYHGGEVPNVATISNEKATVAFKSFDIIFTNTDSSKNHAIERGCDRNKINVIPVGLDINDFKPNESLDFKRNGVLKLISIGRLSEEKGHLFALKSIKYFLKKNLGKIEYSIIGGGPLEKELKEYVSQNNLNDYIKFFGQVERTTLYDELGGSDILILPSIVVGTWQENQALVVQEAMLMKTIPIVSKYGGVPQSICDDVKNWVFDPLKNLELVKILEEIMLLSESDFKKISNNCRKFVLENYDIKTLNSILIKQLINDKNG